MLRKVYLFALVLCLGSFVMYGCATVSDSTTTPADPPSGTTTIEVGSGGSVTGEAGGNSGSLSITLIDQDQVVISGEAYLTTANITIEIWASGVATVEGGISTITAPTAGSAQNFSMAMTFDTSGSMDDDQSSPPQPLTNAVTAAATFVDLMSSSDELALIEFNSSVYPRTPLQYMTTANKATVTATLEGFSASGSTYLYDAIVTAVSTLGTSANSRKATMAMTDGDDSGSGVSISTAINAANNANIPIYSVGFGAGVVSTNLQQLADDTGGLYYYAPSSEALSALYTKISQALTNAWTVGFTTSSITFTSGTTYYIRVTVSYTLADGTISSGSALFTLTI